MTPEYLTIYQKFSFKSILIVTFFALFAAIFYGILKRWDKSSSETIN